MLTISSDSRGLLGASFVALIFFSALEVFGASSASFATTDSLATRHNDSTKSSINSSTREQKFSYRLRSGFDSFANEREQAQFFGLSLGAQYELQLLSNLTFYTRAEAVLSSGYAQSQFGDNVGASNIVLRESLLNFQILDSRYVKFLISGGAIDQGKFEMPTLINSQPFPAVSQKLILGSSNDAQIVISAEQAIPTSKTLSTKTVEAELLPIFTVEMLALELEPVKDLKLKGRALHFAFHDLPSAVALQSQVYGNTIFETGPNTAKFRYGFEGYGVGGSIAYSFTIPLALRLSGFLTQNMQAPEGYRMSQYVDGNIEIGVSHGVQLDLGGAVFFSEDDAAPGFYNDSRMGHNNRQGYTIHTALNFKDQKFRLRSSYTDADIINPNINQTRQQAIMIGFETSYDI